MTAPAATLTNTTILLRQIQEKRRHIRAWLSTAISLREAEARRLMRITKVTALRNWSKREELYDFFHQTSHTRPALVRIDSRRGALFAEEVPTRT